MESTALFQLCSNCFSSLQPPVKVSDHLVSVLQGRKDALFYKTVGVTVTKTLAETVGGGGGGDGEKARKHFSSFLLVTHC